MRVACLAAPGLPLQALLRAEPELGGQPVALCAGEGSRARVQAATAAARDAGVRPGMGASEAQQLCPALVRRWPQPALEAAAASALLDAAASVSPRVEAAGPGRAYVDAQGLGAIWGDERGVAQALVSAARRVGLEAGAAVAGGKQLARLAAERGGGAVAIPPEGARAFLNRLPLAALSPPPELLETLLRWGLSTAGELAALPPEGVGTRLGAAGLALHRLASGEDGEPLFPLLPPTRYLEGCALDFGMQHLEQLLFLLRPALERLLARLECRGLVCGALVLQLKLEPRGEGAWPVGLAAPTREVGDLLALCKAALEARPPGAPVCGLSLVAEPARVRAQQLGLWDLPSVAPSRLLGMVAQLAAIVGPEQVGRLQPLDSHRPEACAVRPFEPPPPASRLSAPPQGLPAQVSLRRYRPPLPAEVRLGPEGPESLAAGGVRGRVVSRAGPWRLELDWHAAPTRSDGYEVELEDGAVYLVALDLVGGGWTVLGRYD